MDCRIPDVIGVSKVMRLGMTKDRSSPIPTNILQLFTEFINLELLNISTFERSFPRTGEFA